MLAVHWYPTACFSNYYSWFEEKRLTYSVYVSNSIHIYTECIWAAYLSFSLALVGRNFGKW